MPVDVAWHLIGLTLDQGGQALAGDCQQGAGAVVLGLHRIRVGQGLGPFAHGVQDADRRAARAPGPIGRSCLLKPPKWGASGRVFVNPPAGRG